MPRAFFPRTLGNNTGGVGPPPTPPAQPTLTVHDNGDGTGGVATIAGSTVGSANVIWISQYSSAGLAFINDASRTGDGTAALSLSIGTYIAYVASTTAGGTTDSVPIVFELTAIPAGTALGGAPVLATKNPFQPMCFAKTPQGDLIGVNGIDQGILWDGYYNYPSGASAFNLGVAPPPGSPSVALSSGGGAVAGAYNIYYRYVDFAGRYSRLSEAAVVSAADGDEFNITVAASSETNRVKKIEIWRTISGGANRVYFITSLDNSTQSYVDSISDSTLENNAVADPTSTILLVNGDGSFDALRYIPPPTNKAVVVWFRTRAFYLVDVEYTTGTVDVTSGSEIVVGLNTDWVPQFIGRYFYAEGAPKGYLIDSVNVNASNVIMLVPGSAPTDAVQSVVLPAATCGTWTWSLDGHTTPTLAYNASAATVKSAIEALAGVGTGNVDVALSGTTYTLTFQGALADMAIDTGSADGTNLCGIPATVTRLAGGGDGTSSGNEIQAVGFQVLAGGDCAGAIQSADGGQFYLSFNGYDTAPISVHPDPSFANAGPTAAEIKAYLETLPSIGHGNVSVVDLAAPEDGSILGVCGASDTCNAFYGTGIMLWQVTFTGALAGEDVPQIAITVTPDVKSTGVKHFGGTLQALQCTIQNGSGGAGSGAAQDEVQQVSLPPGTSGGTFLLSTNGHTTGAIAWNATASDVQSALNTATGGSNFSVTGGNGIYQITFTGAYANTAQSLIAVDTAALTGGTINTTTTTAGSAGVDCEQLLVVGSPTAGTYTLSFSNQTTSPLAFNATASDVQTAFVALSSVGAGNCAVTSEQSGTFLFTFQGTLADSEQPSITADLSALTGAAVVQTLTLDSAYGGTTQEGIDYTIRNAPGERNQVYFSEAFEAESVPNGDPAVPGHDINTANAIKCQQFTSRDDEMVGAIVNGPFCYGLQSNHTVLFDYTNNPMLDGNFSLVATRGAFNNRCAAIIDDVVFLMDREGAFTLQGFDVKPISDDVQNYWREGIIDFSKSDKFFVSADPLRKLARFHYCTSSDTYPQQSLTYNAASGQWWHETYHEELGSTCIYPINGQWRTLFGGASGLVHVSAQGHADVVDSTTETGTLSGAVTSATPNTLVDSSATFRNTMLGAPVAIVSGTAKGQTNYVLSVSGTTLTFTENWGVTPVAGDLYRVGAIQWQHKTGALPLIVQPVAGDTEVPQELARGARIIFTPTAHTAYYDLRGYYDNSPDPFSLYADLDTPSGLSTARGDVSAVQDMSLYRSNIDNVNQPSLGYTLCQFDSGGADFSLTSRALAIYLTGFQCQDKIVFHSIEVLGVEQQ